MTLYQPRGITPFEAVITADGSYVFVTNGKLATMAKTEFEAKYEPVPFVQGR